MTLCKHANETDIFVQKCHPKSCIHFFTDIQNFEYVARVETLYPPMRAHHFYRRGLFFWLKIIEKLKKTLLSVASLPSVIITGMLSFSVLKLKL